MNALYTRARLVLGEDNRAAYIVAMPAHVRAACARPVSVLLRIMLWVGCFFGVWLSYGIRTSAFTLTDLTLTDNDRLLPVIRLLFAGNLTMILGIMFILGVVQISLGNYSLTDFSVRPMLAFLVGAFCGISELLLPATVAKRASDFIAKSK
jgi:hypothetical protein